MLRSSGSFGVVQASVGVPAPVLSDGVGTGQDARMPSPWMGLTDRAGRWATLQAGCHGRSVAEVVRDLAAGAQATLGEFTGE